MREVIHNTVVEAKTSLEKGGWMSEKVGIMHRTLCPLLSILKSETSKNKVW